jgi:hypothetical protein
MPQTARRPQGAPAPATPHIFDTAAAAAYLGVSPRTLQDWRFRGVGPKYLAYSSRACRYRVADLDAWLAAQERTSTSDPGPGAA